MANARFVSERIYQTIVDDITAWCSQGYSVLVSSEDFSGLSRDQWEPLLKLCPEVRGVRAIHVVRMGVSSYSASVYYAVNNEV